MVEEVIKTCGVVWQTGEKISGEPYEFALYNKNTDEYLLLHPLLDARQDESGEPDQFRTAWGASKKSAVERLGATRAFLAWTTDPISVDIPTETWEYVKDG